MHWIIIIIIMFQLLFIIRLHERCFIFAEINSPTPIFMKLCTLSQIVGISKFLGFLCLHQARLTGRGIMFYTSVSLSVCPFVNSCVTKLVNAIFCKRTNQG